MNSYSGKEPYIFLSYSHKNSNEIENLIVGLKQKMCRVWYDEGLTPGESWNDEIAIRLKNATVIVIILTKASMESKYVKSELNYAISNNIKILPVFWEEVELTPGYELMLSTTQHIVVYDILDMSQKVSKLISHLPIGVFASKKTPFFEYDSYSFFLEKNVKTNGASSSEKHADEFSIICECSSNSEKRILFSFEGTAAYDIDYSVTQCKTISDDYFVGNIRGIHIFNVLANCQLDYPLTGPDFQLLLIFFLRITENEFPEICLIDYQYIHITQALSLEGKKVEESPWGRLIDERCRQKLISAKNNC